LTGQARRDQGSAAPSGVVDTVEKPSRRRATAVFALLAVGVGVVAVMVLPNVIGGHDCERGGDCPDIVSRDGTDYVMLFQCQAVRAEVHRSPREGVFSPALHGASDVDVSTFAIAGLPADEVVAVVGPIGVVCPDGYVPGSGVAFSSETDAQTTVRRIEAMTKSR
jgi:hypothetical protein